MVYLVLILIVWILPTPFVWRHVARNYVNAEVQRCSREYPSLWRNPVERRRLIGQSRSESVLPAVIVAIAWPVAVPIAGFYHWVTESGLLISDFERREAAEAEVVRLTRELAETKRLAAQFDLPLPDVDR